MTRATRVRQVPTGTPSAIAKFSSASICSRIRSLTVITRFMRRAIVSRLSRTSSPASMTGTLPTTKVPAPWRRRISPWVSNVRIASRSVARETPSSFASLGSEIKRAPAGVRPISAANSDCKR